MITQKIPYRCFQCLYTQKFSKSPILTILKLRLTCLRFYEKGFTYMNPIYYIPIQTAEAEASLASDDLYSPDLRASLAAGQYKLLRIFSRDIPQRRLRSRSTCKND